MLFPFLCVLVYDPSRYLSGFYLIPSLSVQLLFLSLDISALPKSLHLYVLYNAPRRKVAPYILEYHWGVMKSEFHNSPMKPPFTRVINSHTPQYETNVSSKSKMKLENVATSPNLICEYTMLKKCSIHFTQKQKVFNSIPRFIFRISSFCGQFEPKFDHEETR